MQGDWEKVISVAAPAGAVGLLVGVVSGLIKQRHGSWWGWGRGLLSAVVVAVLVGLGIHDTGISATTQAAIIGVCAFVAADLLDGVLQLATLLRTDPLGFFERVLNALRGGRK